MPDRANWSRQSMVKYCSKRCRTRRIRPIDRRLEAAMLELLKSRPKSSSLCPSEAARAVNSENWRPLMEQARMAARRLVAAGRAEITQGGRVVDPSTAKGPIRVRRSATFEG